MEETNIYHSAKKWQIRLYPSGAAVGMCFYMLMMYVSYIANAGYGIVVAVTGVITTVTRVFDGVTDPICAFISDRINTKHGKVRILMIMGWVVMAITCWIMFVGGVGHGIVFFIIDYCVYIIGYTLFSVGMNLAQPVLTNDPQQRPLYSRWQAIWNLVPTMGISMVVTGVLLPMFGGEYTIPMLGATYYLILAVSLVFLAMSCIAFSEYDKPENFQVGKREKPVSIKDCWHLLKENRALQMYVVAAASDKLALSTAGNAAFVTMLFGILIGNMFMSTIFSALTMPISIAATLLATKMARKQGAKKATIWWTWFAIAAAVLCIVVYLAMDLSQVFKAAVPTIVFMVAKILMSCGQNGASCASGVMMPDIVDYEASRSGNFLPGTVASCYTFLDKIISSFSSTLATISLATIGYTTVMPQPTDSPTTGVLVLTIVMTLVLPILGWLCTILAMKWYPLTKEKMVEVQKINHDKREAAKAEAGKSV